LPSSPELRTPPLFGEPAASLPALVGGAVWTSSIALILEQMPRRSAAKAPSTLPHELFKWESHGAIEYKGFRMTAEETPAGWRIEVTGKVVKPERPATYQDVSDAIDEAKYIVDRPQ
jgi:hypothetical protein